MLKRIAGGGPRRLRGAPRARAKAVDTRMQRRLQQIANLPPEERRQILQLVDAFTERGQLKRRATQAERLSEPVSARP